ncbi:MAG: glycoside hydrolase family 19 protein [Bacteroidia bacterium]
MSTYITTLNSEQKAHVAAIVNEMRRVGITNLFTQAAILSIISKETNFIWKAESGYSTTSNARIRSIFTQLAHLDDAHLTALKANDEAFFNAVYGGKYGNSPTEGFKFRGRGPNELTFKNNYASIGRRIGVDLVNNPDLLITDPNVAAKEVVDFFVREFQTAAKLGKLKQFNTTDINGFTNLTDALNAVFQANRGWGKTGPDTTGGYDKAKSRISEFQNILDVVKDHPVPVFLIAGLALTLATAYFFRGEIKEQFFSNHSNQLTTT